MSGPEDVYERRGRTPINETDIARLNFEVRRFAKMADFTWDGLPVITWEFVRDSEFQRARVILREALGPMMMPPRLVGEDTEEIDCGGVTFRLICKQRRMTRDGPYSSAEVRLMPLPPSPNPRRGE